MRNAPDDVVTASSGDQRADGQPGRHARGRTRRCSPRRGAGGGGGVVEVAFDRHGDDGSVPGGDRRRRQRRLAGPGRADQRDRPPVALPAGRDDRFSGWRSRSSVASSGPRGSIRPSSIRPVGGRRATRSPTGRRRRGVASRASVRCPNRRRSPAAGRCAATATPAPTATATAAAATTAVHDPVERRGRAGRWPSSPHASAGALARAAAGSATAQPVADAAAHLAAGAADHDCQPGAEPHGDAGGHHRERGGDERDLEPGARLPHLLAGGHHTRACRRRGTSRPTTGTGARHRRPTSTLRPSTAPSMT